MDLPFNVAAKYQVECRANPNKPEALSAIRVLKNVLERSDVSTIQGLSSLLNDAIYQMYNADRGSLSVRSACELFQRFITLRILEVSDDFDACKSALLHRADLFIDKVEQCRSLVAKHFLPLLPDNGRVLLHSYSRVVVSVLEYAAQHKTDPSRLHFYVTESLPEGLGRMAMKALARLRLPCTLVSDTAVAYLMPKIDMVLFGAEAVVESGGIVNQIGSCGIAMIAATLGKPVYVLAESFKFIRAYPLDQQHIPEEFMEISHRNALRSPAALNQVEMETDCHRMRQTSSDDGLDEFPEMNSTWTKVQGHRIPTVEHRIPSIDYTNPSYIAYLVTDLGILTPSVVSDELLKLYI